MPEIKPPPDTGPFPFDRIFHDEHVDTTHEDGHLIYIKPALYGRGKKTIPYDVRAYANTSEFFPHETTADQWFDESQFESYRALGLHSVEQISSDLKGKGMAGFFEGVKQYLEDTATAQAAGGREPGSA